MECQATCVLVLTKQFHNVIWGKLLEYTAAQNNGKGRNSSQIILLIKGIKLSAETGNFPFIYKAAKIL